jgi:hypothetical protein
MRITNSITKRSLPNDLREGEEEYGSLAFSIINKYIFNKSKLLHLIIKLYYWAQIFSNIFKNWKEKVTYWIVNRSVFIGSIFYCAVFVQYNRYSIRFLKNCIFFYIFLYYLTYFRSYCNGMFKVIYNSYRWYSIFKKYAIRILNLII